MNEPLFYMTYDNVKLVDGDNFYILYKNKDYTFDIKFWNHEVMEDFQTNKFYLDNKLKFSDKEKMREYIIENELVVNNFEYIFDKKKL